jgi:hypothetical protein
MLPHMSLNEISKMFFILGFLSLGVGGIFFFLGHVPGFGKLPGDILVKKENFTFYFPLTTSIVLSLLISLIFFFVNKR